MVTKGSKNPRKPAEQIAVANATTSELNEREKMKKNVVIFVVPESVKSVLIKRRADDEKKIEEIFKFIWKYEIIPVYTRRLKSKNNNMPGPILFELNEASSRNPVLLAAKKLRSSDEQKIVNVSLDLTDDEREFDFKLKQDMNMASVEINCKNSRNPNKSIDLHLE